MCCWIPHSLKGRRWQPQSLCINTASLNYGRILLPNEDGMRPEAVLRVLGCVRVGGCWGVRTVGGCRGCENGRVLGCVKVGGCWGV